MNRLLILGLALLAACGSETVAPTVREAPIAQLLVADPDTGFWVGESISLSGLITGAVTEDGDTVPAPAGISWALPAHFQRDGDLVSAEREARGAFSASVTTASAEAQVVAVTDLSDRRWDVTITLYGPSKEPLLPRNMIVDSMIRDIIWDGAQGQPARLIYETGFAELRARIEGMGRQIVYWEDGVVDTFYDPNNFRFVQDTLATTANILGWEQSARAISLTPRAYAGDTLPTACCWYRRTSLPVIREVAARP